MPSFGESAERRDGDDGRRRRPGGPTTTVARPWNGAGQGHDRVELDRPRAGPADDAEHGRGGRGRGRERRGRRRQRSSGSPTLTVHTIGTFSWVRPWQRNVRPRRSAGAGSSARIAGVMSARSARVLGPDPGGAVGVPSTRNDHRSHARELRERVDDLADLRPGVGRLERPAEVHGHDALGHRQESMPTSRPAWSTARRPRRPRRVPAIRVRSAVPRGSFGSIGRRWPGLTSPPFRKNGVKPERGGRPAWRCRRGPVGVGPAGLLGDERPRAAGPAPAGHGHGTMPARRAAKPLGRGTADGRTAVRRYGDRVRRCRRRGRTAPGGRAPRARGCPGGGCGPAARGPGDRATGGGAARAGAADRG